MKVKCEKAHCIVNELNELIENYIVKCRYESQVDVKSSKDYVNIRWFTF